jgi:hypothetical protein
VGAEDEVDSRELRLHLEVDIEAQNLELALVHFNSTVWSSLALMLGISRQYLTTFSLVREPSPQYRTHKLRIRQNHTSLSPAPLPLASRCPAPTSPEVSPYPISGLRSPATPFPFARAATPHPRSTSVGRPLPLHTSSATFFPSA